MRNRQKGVFEVSKPRRKPFPEYFKKSIGLQVKQKQAARRKATLEAKKAEEAKKTVSEMSQEGAVDAD